MSLYKIPLVMTPQPEGGYTVTSPVLPELLTEGDTLEEALEHIQDALMAVVELYQDTGKALPAHVSPHHPNESIVFEHLLAV